MPNAAKNKLIERGRLKIFFLQTLLSKLNKKKRILHLYANAKTSINITHVSSLSNLCILYFISFFWLFSLACPLTFMTTTDKCFNQSCDGPIRCWKFYAQSRISVVIFCFCFLEIPFWKHFQSNEMKGVECHALIFFYLFFFLSKFKTCDKSDSDLMNKKNRNGTQHSPINVVFFQKPSNAPIYKINQIDTINMFICRKWTFLFVLCLFCCCAHFIRSKYLIKIQYRLQNDRFCVHACRCVIKSRLVDCLEVQTFRAKLLLFINGI